MKGENDAENGDDNPGEYNTDERMLAIHSSISKIHKPFLIQENIVLMIGLHRTFPVLMRGSACYPTKGVAEVCCAVKAALEGDLLHGETGRLQQLLSMFHAALHDKLVRGHACFLCEKVGKVADRVSDIGT